MAAIRKGRFTISVQIDPPGSCNTKELRDLVRKLKRAGVKVVDVNSSRRLSQDSLHLSGAIQKLGIETIPHITCRDSTVNGLLNQILGAHSWNGISHFLIIAGDPYEAKHPAAISRGVFEADSASMVAAIRTHLQSGLGLKLKIGVALNQNEPNLEYERERLKKKIESGADFIMTQPIFSLGEWNTIKEKFGDLLGDLPVLAGVWPITSRKTAVNIKNGAVAGVTMPKDFCAELETLASLTDDVFAKIGLKTAGKLIRKLKDAGANGVYVVAPLRNPAIIIGMLREIE